MRQTIHRTYQSLTYNLKTLIYFEVLYRVLGLLIIFPVARFLFYYSVRLSGQAYVTNQLFFTYLLNPATITVMLCLTIILSIYLVIEMIFLSLIYDFGYHERVISFKDLIILGLKKSYLTFKKYHILIIAPAFLLFFTVQLIHLMGIYSTITFPIQIVQQLNRMTFLKWSLYTISGLFVILFFETSLTLNLYTLDQLSFRNAYHQSRLLLKKQRLKMILEFVVINMLLNILFYGIYLLIIFIIGLFVLITKDQSYVLGVLLTLMYSIYAVIGLIASSFLIPINYALLSTWYYSNKERLGLSSKIIRLTNKDRKAFSFKTLKRVSIGLLVVLFALNISSIISIIRQDRVQLELFNYAEIIAHRGASHDAPENTLAALELAIVERVMGIEPTSTAWKAVVLPLNYTRI
jgi:glycerophosphoryl diester phosphodiesterase